MVENYIIKRLRKHNQFANKVLLYDIQTYKQLYDKQGEETVVVYALAVYVNYCPFIIMRMAK